MTDLLSEITFCDECPYSGEPNGCNREEGVCKAHESYFDLVEENAALHERLKEAEHRAEVAERALYNACCEQNKHWCVQCDSFAECDTSNEMCIEAKKHAEELIKQAEKCAEYRKLYFDLLTKTTAARMEK